MPFRLLRQSFIAVGLVASLCAGSVLAQNQGQNRNTSLPGGATSLREVHGDWVVNCLVVGEGQQARKACTMLHDLREPQSGQRIAALELQPSTKATPATLALPFGLELASGVQLQVDQGARGQALPFRTCLPGGCMVPVSVDQKMLGALRAGSALRVFAKPEGQDETSFSISLRGFAAAYDRASELAR